MAVKWFFRLVLNSVLGFLLLIACRALSLPPGAELGVNPLNAAVIGVFGVPGFATLLILRYLLIT